MQDIYGWLGEHSGQSLVKKWPVNALHVIAVDQPHRRKAGDAQKACQFCPQRGGLHGELRLFLHICPKNHANSSMDSLFFSLLHRPCADIMPVMRACKMDFLNASVGLFQRVAQAGATRTDGQNPATGSYGFIVV